MKTYKVRAQSVNSRGKLLIKLSVSHLCILLVSPSRSFMCSTWWQNSKMHLDVSHTSIRVKVTVNTSPALSFPYRPN